MLPVGSQETLVFLVKLPSDGSQLTFKNNFIQEVLVLNFTLFYAGQKQVARSRRDNDSVLIALYDYHFLDSRF